MQNMLIPFHYMRIKFNETRRKTWGKDGKKNAILGGITTMHRELKYNYLIIVNFDQAFNSKMLETYQEYFKVSASFAM